MNNLDLSYYRPRTMAEMNNFEFKAPDLNITNCMPRAKRLVDLDCTIQFSTKKNHNNYNGDVTASARKYSSKKPTGLSKNMSTSKKIAIQKRATTNNIRRAIDFTGSLQKVEDKNLIKSTPRRTFAPSTSITKGNASVGKKKENINRERNNTELFNVTNYLKSSTCKKSPLSEDKNKQETNLNLSCINRNTIMGKSNYSVPKKNKNISFKKSVMIKTDDSFSNTSSSSDKENDLINKKTLKMSVPDELAAFLDSPNEIIKNIEMLKQSNIPPELKNLIQKNMEISSKLITITSQLLENTVKILNTNITYNLSNSNNSHESPKEIPKKKTVRSPLKSINIDVLDYTENNESMSDDSAKITDLRKIALLNSEKSKAEKKSSPVMTKSLEAYKTLRSHLRFLNTPNHNGFHTNDIQTPNTRCRAITSNNVQRQLEQLYDS